MKYVRLLLFTFILLTTEKTEAQLLGTHWTKEFRGQGRGEDYLACQVMDSIGNIYLAGSSQSDKGMYKILIVKTNIYGDTLWTYYVKGATTDDNVEDMLIGPDGNLYLTGSSYSKVDQAYSFITLKFDTSGSLLWGSNYGVTISMPYDDFRPNKILVDNLSNIYVSGSKNSHIGIIIKYSASGQLLWEKDDLGLDGDPYISDMQFSKNGHLTVCGNFYSNSNSKYIYFVNQYHSGNSSLLWSDTIQGTQQSNARKMKVLNDGQLIVSGQISSLLSGAVYMAVKYDTLGNRLWTCNTLNNGFNSVNLSKPDMAIDDSGNIYIAGYDPYLNGKAILSRINYDGTQSWRRDWDVPSGNGDEVFNKIVLDSSGGVYVTGWGIFPGPNYENTGGIPNQIVVKYTTSGDSLWTIRPKDTLNVSRGITINIFNEKIIASGTSSEIANRNPNFFLNTLDTSGMAISEWIYNGEGDVKVDSSKIIFDANNNVYVAATIERYGNEGKDVVIIKYDPWGNEIWNRYYSSPGTNNDTLTCFDIDSTGNLVLMISSDSLRTRKRYNLSIVRMNVQGNFLDTTWITLSSYDNVIAVKNYCLPNGNYIVGANSTNLRGVIFRMDTVGNIIWLNQVDTNALVISYITKMIQCDNGEIGLTGYAQQGSYIDRMGFVQKISASGIKLWYTLVDSINVGEAFSDLAEHSDGNIAVTGNCGNSSSVALICKLDGQSGALIWRTVYKPNSYVDYGRQIGFLSSGKILVVTQGSGVLANPKLNVVCFDSTGVPLWTNISVNAHSAELFIAGDDLITLGGRVSVGLRFFGLDSSGTILFNNILYNTLTAGECITDINLDYAKKFYTTGFFSDSYTGQYIGFPNCSRIITTKYQGVFVGLNEVSGVKNGDIYAYPNPSSNGRFTLVDASGKSPITRGRVFDSSGKMISTLDLISQEINLSGFPIGLYLLQYERNNLPSGTVKLMVE